MDAERADSESPKVSQTAVALACVRHGGTGHRALGGSAAKSDCGAVAAREAGHGAR